VLNCAYSSLSSGAGPESRLAMSVKNLYSGMAQTTEAVTPFALISNLRTLAPQFAEQDQRGNFAQQGGCAT
jgi:ubiquitin carboxyl-terminal hydrolase 14